MSKENQELCFTILKTYRQGKIDVKLTLDTIQRILKTKTI